MTKRIQVLYVDDEPGLLEIGKIYLEESSEFSVDTVQSAPAALEILNNKTYDAIVSDFMMPKMNGIELLKKVRVFDKIIPFILFTGRGREEVVIDAINNGADFYIQKGGDVQAQFAELSHKIRQAVLMRRTQMTLAEQEQRYHDLQNANDLIQSVAPDGHFLFVNNKWLDTLGYKEEDLPNLTLFDVIHEESLKHCMTTFQRVISGENVGIIDTVFRTRDGKKVYVEGMTNCKLVEGTCQYTRGIFKDVTDRKKAELELLQKNEELTATEEELRHNYDLLTQNERKLRENEAKYRDLAELLPQMIFETDLDLQITYANQQAHTLLGFTVQDFERGINALSLIDPSQHVIMRGNVQKSLSKIPFEPMEYTARRKDGSTFPVSIYSSCLYRDNTLAGFRAVVVDISARKKMEEGIYESEKKFRALVELSLDGIFITDFTGKLLFVNQAAGKIVDAPDYEAMIEKKNVMEYVAPESQADVLRDISQVAQGIDAYLVHYKLITETKREVWVECIGKKIPFGDASAMLVSMRDITGRKRDEERVRESEKKFATIFRNSPVSLTLVSATDGTIIDVNDAFLRSTGYSRHEVVGNMAVALGIFADRTEYKRFSTILRNQRTVHGMEMKCRIKNGEIRTCRFSSGIIMMDGKPHILSTVDDITERKTTELAIQALVRSIVGTTGLDSLGKITENVSSWLGADCVMVGEIQPDRLTVKVLSMLLDRKEVHDFSYTLKGTPCENVADKGFCLYPDNAIQIFPESKDLVELKIRGYVGTPLRNYEGHVIGILCALSRNPLTHTPTIQEIMDIIAVKAAAEVERIQTERALNESEGKYRTLFDNAGDVIFIHDMNGRILAFNTLTCEKLGYTRPELMSMMVGEVDSPENAPQAPARIARLKEQVHISFETVHRRKDDSLIPIVVSAKLISWEGQPAVMSICHDITERKKIEEALRQSEEKFRKIFENSPLAITLVTPDLRFHSVNPSWISMTGYSEEELLKMSFKDITHPDYLAGDLEHMQDLAAGTIPVYSTEKRYIRKDKSILWGFLRVVPIRDQQGSLRYFAAQIEDITERKRDVEALRQANKKLNILSGITRHDIKNQLLTLDSFLALLHKKIPDPSLEYFFSRINRSSNQITNMIQFTKEYEMIGVHAPKWQDIRILVENAGRDNALGQISLKNDLPAHTEVYADPLITKVFSNLIDNAVRHGGKITTIRFSLEEREGERIVVCEDDGDGVAPEEKDRIFDLGFGKNTGFGLSISREILDITGITIKEIGEAGKGARFEIAIPGGQYRSTS